MPDYIYLLKNRLSIHQRNALDHRHHLHEIIGHVRAQRRDGETVDFDKQFDEIRENQKLKSKVVVNRAFVIEGGKGKEFQMEFEHGIVGSYRLFAVGNKSYQMRVEGKGMTLDNPEVKRYFGSFKIKK